MGRPKGAENRHKEWRDAIRKAVHELRAVSDGDSGKKLKALRLIAEKVVSKAMDGDLGAIKEIADRLDGKATQAIDLGVSVQITKVEHVIVDARPPVIEGEVIEVIEDKTDKCVSSTNTLTSFG